jgi:hypothetical protein
MATVPELIARRRARLEEQLAALAEIERLWPVAFGARPEPPERAGASAAPAEPTASTSAAGEASEAAQTCARCGQPVKPGRTYCSRKCSAVHRSEQQRKQPGDPPPEPELPADLEAVELLPDPLPDQEVARELYQSGWAGGPRPPWIAELLRPPATGLESSP